MRCSAKRISSCAVLLVLSACAGNSFETPSIRPDRAGTLGRPKSAQVRISIALAANKFIARPASASAAPAGNPSSAQSAAVQLSAPGQTTLTYPVPCAAATCQTLFAAPAGLWTFGVTLYSGPGQTGSVLAQGTTTEAIALGANTVALTFNAVVASASVTIDPSEAPPYLSSIGPTNARLDVAFKDPSGATIIGPNLFVAAGNPTCIPTTSAPCLTATLTDSDTSGATSLSVSSFTSANSGATTTLALNTSSTIPPFDVAGITISAPGVFTLFGTSVPISPTVNTIWGPATQGVGSGASGPGIKSLSGHDAFQLNRFCTSGNCDGNGNNDLYIYSPHIENLANDGSICCATALDNITLQGGGVNFASVGDHLLGGLPAAPSIVGNTSDTVVWFADETFFPSNTGAFSVADLTQTIAYNDVVPFPLTSIVTSSISDPSHNIWFAMMNPTTSVSLVGAFSATSPPATAPNFVSLPADRSVVGLVNGPAGFVFAVAVSAEGQTYIDKLALTNVNAGGTFSGEQALSPPTDLRANSANGLFPIVGYSPADGMLYASDTHGKLYRINPTTGASSSFPVDGAPAASDDPNRLPMALLPDNSLAYVGSANVDGNTASNANATCGNGSCVYIHVIPGTNPTATSFAPACSSTNAPCAYGIWSVETSGTPPNYGINLWSTDGGHIKASIW